MLDLIETLNDTDKFEIDASNESVSYDAASLQIKTDFLNEIG